MKKSKLFLSLVSLCFALAVLCFGVYAANQVNYTISGNISYRVTDAYVDVTTSIYAMKDTMSRLDVRNALDDMCGDRSTTNNITEITSQPEKYEFVKSENWSSVNSNSNTYNFGNLNISGSHGYFFVFSVKKTSSDTPNVWVAMGDNVTESANTFIYDNMFTYNIGLTPKTFVVGVGIADPTQNINPAESISFDLEFGTGITIDSIANSDWMKDKLSFNLVEDDEDYYEVSQSSDEIAGLVVIPASYDDVPVKAIAEYGFYSENTIREVYIPTSIEVLEDWSIAGTINNINFQNFSGTEISFGSFCRTDLVKIIIPEGVETIMGGTFGSDEESNSYLASIELPSSLENIYTENDDGFPAPFTYYSESLVNIIVDESNLKFYSENNCLIEKIGLERRLIVAGKMNSISSNTITQIGARAFLNNTLTSFSFPNVTEVGEAAFWGCVNLTSAYLSSAIKIGNYAFEGCISLTQIDLNNVIKIGLDAFLHCTSLVYIDLGENIENLGSSAFYDTPWLSSLTSNENGLIFATAGNVKYLMGFDDSRVSSDFVITSDMLTGVRGIYPSALHYQSKISKVTIPTSVKFIGYSAFIGNSNTLTVECLATTAQDIPTLLDQYGSNANNSTSSETVCSGVYAVKIPSGTRSLYASVWTYLFDNYSSKISEVA